jgi:hypothetical protein
MVFHLPPDIKKHSDELRQLRQSRPSVSSEEARQQCEMVNRGGHGTSRKKKL